MNDISDQRKHRGTFNRKELHSEVLVLFRSNEQCTLKNDFVALRTNCPLRREREKKGCCCFTSTHASV